MRDQAETRRPVANLISTACCFQSESKVLNVVGCMLWGLLRGDSQGHGHKLSRIIWLPAVSCEKYPNESLAEQSFPLLRLARHLSQSMMPYDAERFRSRRWWKV